MRSRPTRTITLWVILTALVLLAPCLALAQLDRFAIVSDTHVGSPNHSVYPEVISMLDEDGIDVVMHAGDAINSPGDVSEWEKFLEITGPDKTLHLAPGNHDINGKSSLETYLHFFDAPYSSFSEGDTLFVFLNTELPGQESRIEGAQLAWLESELAKPFRYKFIFLHEPLFPAMPRHGLDRHKAQRDELHRLFVRCGVALVVAGHDHLYERKARDGVLYIICGRAGGRAWPGRNGNSFSYIVAERTGDLYRLTVRDLEGTVKDSIKVARPPLTESTQAPGEDEAEKSAVQVAEPLPAAEPPPAAAK